MRWGWEVGSVNAIPGPRLGAQLTCPGEGWLAAVPFAPRDLTTPHPSGSPFPPSGEKAGFLRSWEAQAPSRSLLPPTLPLSLDSSSGSEAALLPGTPVYGSFSFSSVKGSQARAASQAQLPCRPASRTPLQA